MLKSSANEWFRLTSIEYQTTVDMCEGLIKIMLAMSVDRVLGQGRTTYHNFSHVHCYQ
jgi:hypothetical protein